MSNQDQFSSEPPKKSRCIIRNRISSVSEEGIESNEVATAVADVDHATKEARKTNCYVDITTEPVERIARHQLRRLLCWMQHPG